jgi:hypothetical protein
MRRADALIKERKKEEKAKKREEGATKAKAPAAPVKTQSHEAQKMVVKSQQTAKRNAIVSKNRGLPAAPAAGSNGAQKNAKKSVKKTTKTKTSITEVTAQLRHKMRVTKSGGQQRASIKSVKKVGAQSSASTQRIVRKQEKQGAPKPNTPANQKAKKQTQLLASANQPAKTKDRSVVRADSKTGKLKITFSSGNGSKRSRFKKTNTIKRQQTPPIKKVLPGKLSAKVRKQQTSSKKTGKQSKKSRKHQATASVVRQPFASRKKKN